MEIIVISMIEKKTKHEYHSKRQKWSPRDSATQWLEILSNMDQNINRC